jgi:hypothetical protein
MFGRAARRMCHPGVPIYRKLVLVAQRSDHERGLAFVVEDRRTEGIDTRDRALLARQSGAAAAAGEVTPVAQDVAHMAALAGAELESSKAGWPSR